MHSYLQRHIRTHGSSVPLPCSNGGGRDGVTVKASVGGVTTTTTLLNPITLEASGNHGSLIVSQPALNIPLNTSQNYFMIQTVSGLQLIPLSSPPPAPPPPPPPPPLPLSQPQNFFLLQCPSNNSGQSSLILVPTANNPPPAPEPQTLPVLQTIQTLQPVLNQTQTQIPQIQTISQQQQQTRIIITNNNNNANTPVATQTHSLISNSLLTRPILGKSTRTARGRRGRKPKTALQKPVLVPVSEAAGAAQSGINCNSVTQTVSAANTAAESQPSSSSSLSTPCTTVPILPASTSATTTVDNSGSTLQPATTATSVSSSVLDSMESKPHSPVEQIRTEEAVAGKQFVLCFDNEEQAKEGVSLGEGGQSYVLQFQGDASGEVVDGGMDGEGKSLVLQLKTNGQGEEEKGEDKGEMMSLLHEWSGEKHLEPQTGDSSQSESYVLRFHTEAQESSCSSATFSQGQETSLQISCTPTQSLVPLDGQEVVFELGSEAKMEQDTEEGMQMIALIEGEGGMVGEDEAGCNATRAEGTEGRGPMDRLFQLEGGEEIVIIEVSTSGLREGRMERGGDGEIPQSSEVKYDNATADAKENSVSSTDHTEAETLAEETSKAGPVPNSKEMKFPS